MIFLNILKNEIMLIFYKKNIQTGFIFVFTGISIKTRKDNAHILSVRK